jgi:hypothetical protein
MLPRTSPTKASSSKALACAEQPLTAPTKIGEVQTRTGTGHQDWDGTLDFPKNRGRSKKSVISSLRRARGEQEVSDVHPRV